MSETPSPSRDYSGIFEFFGPIVLVNPTDGGIGRAPTLSPYSMFFAQHSPTHLHKVRPDDGPRHHQVDHRPPAPHALQHDVHEARVQQPRMHRQGHRRRRRRLLGRPLVPRQHRDELLVTAEAQLRHEPHQRAQVQPVGRVVEEPAKVRKSIVYQ